jgi:hypothetical protein
MLNVVQKEIQGFFVLYMISRTELTIFSASAFDLV